jgi:chaperonin GroES
VEKLRPLFDRVLLEREQLKAGSIIIPETARDRNAPSRGLVVAVGPTCTGAVKKGDRVLFGQHAGATLRVDGIETFVVAEEDIIAVVET